MNSHEREQGIPYGWDVPERSVVDFGTEHDRRLAALHALAQSAEPDTRAAYDRRAGEREAARAEAIWRDCLARRWKARTEYILRAAEWFNAHDTSRDAGRPVELVRWHGETVLRFRSCQSAARFLGVTRNTVREARAREGRWKVAGAWFVRDAKSYRSTDSEKSTEAA